MKFADRTDAGRRLAERLTAYEENENVLVLGLPRGGVPVAAEVAEALGAPLDVFLVRKLGVPGHEELAIGAVATGDAIVVNDSVVHSLNVSDEDFRDVVRKERLELQRREIAYRNHAPPPKLAGKIAILVDDGLATGATMRVAVDAVRKQGPAKIVVAVPVGARETVAALARFADEVVCASMPDNFLAVGRWYADFSTTTDEEVVEALERDARRRGVTSGR
jgi:predicted phosphoribosyltransferase